MTTHTDLATRAFGGTGLELSTVGLGAWAIGGPWDFGWGPQDDAESVRAIHHAVTRGVTWIDTAAVYGLGHAEEVVGQAVRDLPEADRPLVFTKCGMTWVQGSTSASRVGRPDSIVREAEDSLRRLGVEAIDLLQLHQVPEDGTSIEDAWGALVGLRDAGKIRFAGVSNFDAAQLAAIEPIGHVDTLQPPLSLINRKALDGTLPWCAEHGTGVIVYSPMQSGLLSGTFSADRVASLADGDWRRQAPEFTPPRLERNLALVADLAQIALRIDCSVPELAIAWTLAQPGVSAAIVGARRPDQVDGWVESGALTLDRGVLDEITAALERRGAGAGPTAS